LETRDILESAYYKAYMSYEVCNGKSVESLVELGMVTMNEYSKEGLARRVRFCDSLKNGNDRACRNVRQYCREFLAKAATSWVEAVQYKVVNDDKSEFFAKVKELVADERNYQPEYSSSKPTALEKLIGQ
jgi:hypothetical protein